MVRLGGQAWRGTEDSPGRVRERAQGEPQQCHCRSGQGGDYGIFKPPGNRAAAAGSESPLGLANRQALISPFSLQWGSFGLGACPAPRSLQERLGRCFLEHQRPASTLATYDYSILSYYKFSSSVTPATLGQWPSCWRAEGRKLPPLQNVPLHSARG